METDVAQTLESFLDEFVARPEIAKHMAAARRELEQNYADGGIIVIEGWNSMEAWGGTR